MGYISLSTKQLGKRCADWGQRGVTRIVLLCLSVLLLATPAESAPARTSARAGSNLSGVPNRYGRTNRPYRRRSKSKAQQTKSVATAEPESTNEKIDYRIDADYESDFGSTETFADPSLYTEEATYEPESHEPSSIEQAGFCDCVDGCNCGDSVEPGCGCTDGCDSVGCGDRCFADGCGWGSCGSRYRRGTTWVAGFEWTFVKPRFSDNVAFTVMDGNGVDNFTFSDTEFDYDLQLAPRVWLEADINKNWGWRLSYWQYDQSPDVASASPRVTGQSEITHPAFLDVDNSTDVMDDTFTASSSLNAYTIDFEAVKQSRLSGWNIGVAGGIRYASAEQGYFAQLRDDVQTLRGQIDFEHEIEGFGPTVSLAARRALFQRVNLAFAARGSLLFGEGQSLLVAGEDLDLATPITTTRTTDRDDLLPIGEARIGLEWTARRKHRKCLQWFVSTALEGQIWGNAGNAASETADLGFFGFNIGAGLVR